MENVLEMYVAKGKRLEFELHLLDKDLSHQPVRLQLLALEQEFERFVDDLRRRRDDLRAQLVCTQKISRAVNAYQNTMNLNNLQSW